jgi:hypothetical protein
VAAKVSGRRRTLAEPKAAAVLGLLAVALMTASLPVSDLSDELTFNGTSGGVGNV